MNKTVTVSALLDRLAREELKLKTLGAYAEAAGVRDAVVLLLRMADETPVSDTMEASE